MVIDFAAAWCGPRKFMEPAVHGMATKFSDVVFAKIDVDELPVRILSRFVFFVAKYLSGFLCDC